MIHEMHGCQCMILKEIKIIFASMIICSIVGNPTHPPEGKVLSINNLKNEKKLPLTENLRVKSLSCFQINKIVFVLCCGGVLGKPQHSVRSIF